MAPSIELVACPWVFPHPRSCCCRRIYAFLSVSAARAGPPPAQRPRRLQPAARGGLQLARLPGALNQARPTRRSTRLSTTLRNFKLMEAALPWISESEAAKSHCAPVPSRTPRPCHRARRARAVAHYAPVPSRMSRLCHAERHATPHQRRPRPPPSSTRQRGIGRASP